ncbi:MAG TPA: hypothetical protein VIM63_00475 [Rhodoferax sp.]
MIGLTLGTMLAALAALLGMQTWLSSPATQQMLTQQATQALGVEVSVGQLHLLTWPPLALELNQVVLHTKPTLSLRQLRVQPSLTAALRGSLGLSSVHLQDAELSQAALETLILLQKKALFQYETRDRA